jgi:hypothetical protein
MVVDIKSPLFILLTVLSFTSLKAYIPWTSIVCTLSVHRSVKSYKLLQITTAHPWEVSCGALQLRGVSTPLIVNQEI